jgi:diguanylate cyclase (GGDEF)-like protein
MKQTQIDSDTIEGFPSYLEYQCERLIPVANLLLSLSIVNLMVFALVDFYQYPDLFEQIMSLRFLAALPLMLLISLLNKPTLKHNRAPIYFLLLGLLSFAFLLAMNLSVPDKKDILVLVPLFYIIAVLAMAPLFKSIHLVLCFLLGTSVYYFTANFFSNENQMLSMVFSQMVAIIIFTLIAGIKIKQSAEENYQLAKSLHWRSHHDTLTHALNRRGIFSWIEGHKLFTGQSFEAVSLAMIDLDHFKQVNDVYGHAVGDDVIKTSTEIIASLLDKHSTLARFGGEEFLVVLREGSDAKNLSCAEKILTAFRSHAFQSKQDSPLRVTVSIGYINYRQPNTFEDTLKIADKLLYHAKNNGRDQLVNEKKYAR